MPAAATTTTIRPKALEAVVPRLYATAPEPLPFAPALHVRAFLLQRPAGNVLVYAAPGLADHATSLDALGGISRRYLNHWHEAMFATEPNGAAMAPLFVHRADGDAVRARGVPVRATFDRRHSLDDDLEVIPTPGHTPGATVYLWRGGEHRILFTGDTVYLDHGEWVAAVLESSDRETYLESLALLRELEFDLLVPWAASEGDPPYAATDRTDAQRRIDAIIARLRSGGDR